MLPSGGTGGRLLLLGRQAPRFHVFVFTISPQRDLERCGIYLFPKKIYRGITSNGFFGSRHRSRLRCRENGILSPERTFSSNRPQQHKTIRNPYPNPNVDAWIRSGTQCRKKYRTIVSNGWPIIYCTFASYRF